MLAERILGCQLHAFQIDRRMNVQGSGSREHIRMQTKLHRVAIGLVLCGKARVEFLRRFFAVEHADIPRKSHVERNGELVRRHARIGIKVRNLRAGMYAAVGSARTVELDVLARDGKRRLVEPLLDGNAVVLQLPADVVGTIVGDDQADAAAHSGRFSKRIMPTSTAVSSSVAKRSRQWKCSSRMRVLPSPP